MARRKRIQVMLTNEEKQAVEALAQRLGLSLSNAVRVCVRALLLGEVNTEVAELLSVASTSKKEIDTLINTEEVK